MTSPILTQMLADDYHRERLAAAGRGRLAALARCCRPSELRRAIAEFRRRVGHRSAVCCA